MTAKDHKLRTEQVQNSDLNPVGESFICLFLFVYFNISDPIDSFLFIRKGVMKLNK